MTATITATDITNMQEAAKKAADESPDVIEFASEPGNAEPQGDVNMLCFKSLPTDAKPRKDRQVADGNSKGSRHVLSGNCPLYDVDPDAWRERAEEVFPGLEIRDYMVGPVFELGEGENATLEHPEHSHFTFTGPCVVGISFQRTVTADGREQRALD